MILSSMESRYEQLGAMKPFFWVGSFLFSPIIVPILVVAAVMLAAWASLVAVFIVLFNTEDRP